MNMNNLACDYIAVDTNIFEHLLNPAENINNHITILLQSMIDDKVGLIVDKKGVIKGEYLDRLIPRIKESYDKGYNFIFRYYFTQYTKELQVSVEQNDALMTKIKEIIPNVSRDRVFIYVALIKDKVLITNDRKDILDKGNIRNKRRNQLLKMANQQGYKSANIYDSLEAHGEL